MPLEFKKNMAKFSGYVGVEEAETLFNWLLETKNPKVDLSEAEHLHTACLQLLLIFKPEIVAWSPKEELKWISLG